MCYWLQLILRELALYMLHFCFNLYCCPWNQNVQRGPLLKISKQSDGRTLLTPPRLLTWLFVEISMADSPIMLKRIQNPKKYLLALLCLHARSNPLCAHSGHMLHSSVKSISNLMKKKDVNQKFRHQKGCACATFECGNILLAIVVFSCKSNINLTDNACDRAIFTFYYCNIVFRNVINFWGSTVFRESPVQDIFSTCPV